ncbi:hypothetical protein ACJJJB_01680 [Microbulbifer sp. ANSA001]|uniref:hypothetical protein n=1 Tax=Microbulbifer sp. ANSA001 TaxID=3243358 RepID=UPI0040438934
MILAISDLFGKAIDKAFPDKAEANRLKERVVLLRYLMSEFDQWEELYLSERFS